MRRAALLCAFGTLVAALYLCARAGGGEGLPGVHPVGPGSGPGPAVAHSALPHAPDRTVPLGYPAYVCPYDLPRCSPFSHVTPGVLPVPPPAVTAPRAEPPAARVAASAGAVRPPQPAARPPDLHVLQVLRT
ncbi:hypothetical protein DEJ50_23880 [Streptomyces venezuelae]|uniref:Uncharacterized protein n=1 Tax=Streptomyces venezuelae TaxID=54571 RepID=A0A5P2D870_STRVZ|nr:hypothetical protein DEJ50_23880 [Streptomyces venezuelae]